jgi:predicted DNA-binding transcriptional regulator AlpA
MEHVERELLLGLPVVDTLTGLSANTIIAAAKAGSFPSPVDFNGDEVWLSADIANWLEKQPQPPLKFEWGESV